MIEIITTALISNALALMVLAFLSKSIIKHFLDKDISNFKTKIQLKANEQIEAYKSTLEIERLRLQISYGGIFEKQAEAILSLYKNLTELSKDANMAVHGSDTPTNRKILFRKSWDEFTALYYQLKILLPQDLDSKLKEFQEKILNIVFQNARIEQYLGRNLTDSEYDKFENKQNEIYTVFAEEIPNLEKSLINKMRRVLGVQNSNI